MRTETKRTREPVEREQVGPAEGRFNDFVNPSTGEAYAGTKG